MELLGLFVVVLLIYLLVAPIVAWVRASSASNQVEACKRRLSEQAQQIEQLQNEVVELRNRRAVPAEADAADTVASSAPRSESSIAERGAPTAQQSTAPSDPDAELPANGRLPAIDGAVANTDAPPPAADVPTPPSYDLPPPLVKAPVAPPKPSAPPALSAATDVRFKVAPSAEQTESAQPQPPAGATQPAASSTQAAAAARPPPRPAPKPRQPSALELLISKSVKAAKDWLFGGNLVAKIGLLILFIGVAFLLRLASSYVDVSIGVRLSAIAAGAIGLLAWGWKIRLSRPGIALPAQGAALAILMLVTFGAFKRFDLIPGGAAFTLLFVLVGFTCILAVLQNALWLAIFGIAGGFAAPILTSSGSGSHVALFSYYALLNAGILAIALKRSWRILNLIGFAFTFIIGAAWGYEHYEPEHYASSQFFLALFVLFYIAIAVLYAWRQAPRLKSYVDGTLVFGVPTLAMGLQYELVKGFHLGTSLSAVAFGLLYAAVAAALWRWRRGSLRLLVESFFALAVVFGTLAIPLALDGRWTSAAWALEGAAIIWIGLRQKQALVWRFGLLVQLGSWLAFFKSLTGLDPISALRDNLWLGFGVLGATAVFLALTLRGKAADNGDEETTNRRGWNRLATGFMVAAVVWILSGLWLEIWLRVSGEDRASLLVISAFALVYGLQWLARRSAWRVPTVLAGAVTALTGVAFIGLMLRYMNWSNSGSSGYESLPEVLANGALVGGGLLSGAAWVSALAFKHSADQLSAEGADASKPNKAAGWWLIAAIFWCSGFAIHGAAHALSWLSGAASPAPAWHSVEFWPAYGVLLAISAWGWMHVARRWQLPNASQVLLVIWPALTAIGSYAFLINVQRDLPSSDHLLSFNWIAPMPFDGGVSGALLAFLGSPLSGAAILAAIAWLALTRVRNPVRTPELKATERPGSILIWCIGLALMLHWPIADSVALLGTHLLGAVGASDELGRSWLTFVDMRLLFAGFVALAAVQLSTRLNRPELKWLALPTVVIQVLATLAILGRLYFDARLPRLGTGAAILGLWLSMDWALRHLRASHDVPRPALQLAHFGRVIGPWLMVPALVSLNLMPLLASGESGNSWIVAGMWPDYIAAWLAIGLLIVGLRQVRSGGWPLRPIADWYGNIVIPLAAAWSLLLVIYWNLRQDGSMQPLPYLPLLNPLDLTTGFVALLLADLWRMHRAQLDTRFGRLVIRATGVLVFAWFNLIMLRTAAHYLGLPYRFDDLYESQFVQAMLSLVWTLCAFGLMRYALRGMSKPVWMVGAGLLALVVVKLFAVDLKSVGSIARIVSFMGVGGLMLLIGYLAPLPRGEDQEAETENPTDSEPPL